jgi:hypothetical protein
LRVIAWLDLHDRFHRAESLRLTFPRNLSAVVSPVLTNDFDLRAHNAPAEKERWEFMSVSSVGSTSGAAALLAASQTKSQTADPPNDGDGDTGDAAVPAKAALAAGTGQVVDTTA